MLDPNNVFTASYVVRYDGAVFRLSLSGRYAKLAPVTGHTRVDAIHLLPEHYRPATPDEVRQYKDACARAKQAYKERRLADARTSAQRVLPVINYIRAQLASADEETLARWILEGRMDVVYDCQRLASSFNRMEGK